MNVPSYCNPLSIKDYPMGGDYRSSTNRQYRSLADPTVIYSNGKWYMYPSYAMAYVSNDFIHWEYHQLDNPNVGFAPTVMEKDSKFYMTACAAPLYVSDSPLGPFKELGSFHYEDQIYSCKDPMLFLDDDGRVYLYWGLGGPGIFGVELDAKDLTSFKTKPKKLMQFETEHSWERFGDHNQCEGRSSLEGSWMVKRNGRYYLTYTGPGTCYRTYGMGAYYSDESPLGPFTYQKRNPILQNLYGLVRGPGHGCFVEGPKNTLWAFFTCTVCCEHKFERRVGMVPAGVDENGELFALAPSDIPQFAPGVLANPELGNDTQLLPLTFSQPDYWISSCAPGRDAVYALDESMLSWWQPDVNDLQPSFALDLRDYYDISASRLIWKDVNLDTTQGKNPGAFGYVIECCSDMETNKWETLIDASNNHDDLLIDYRTFAGKVARYVRLRITKSPQGIAPGVVSFVVYGKFFAVHK